MKKYKCHLDTEQKLLSSNGQEVMFVHGELYTESHFINTFPNLFKEHLEHTTPKKKSKPIEAPQRTKKSKPKVTTPKKEESVVDTLIEAIQPNTKTEFNWYRFILLGVSILVISAISAYLRIHGIMSVFDVSLVTASILVAGFVVSEFSISSLMLREIKSKFHHILNLVVLGTIQLLLLIVSFIFEFSTMSNYIEKQKVDLSSNTDTVVLVRSKLENYNEQITSLQKQIEITPDDYISKRSRLTSQLNKAIEAKNKESDKLDVLINNKNVNEVKKDGVGFENTAKLLGVEEETVTKSVIMIIAGILNTLYVSFMYGFISEWKRRK